ncbi:thioredoxin-like 3-2, chloroplastic isoform X2 [Carica papaya]|uniref:thioredoxin-like 3-2, chloroplastic isoform X2 n=1 Tax=Carica papaya TaxID=3649 RepID=UPI000B8CE205|nr:thioredoxin-like 3-2, chloroplastic isoform X2 [Carica papaya]
MSETVSLSLSVRSLRPRSFSVDCSTVVPPIRASFSTWTTDSFPKKSLRFPGKISVIGVNPRVLNAGTDEGSWLELDDSPVSVELQPICSEAQLDQVIAEAQQLDEPVVVLWMANWCRKCIYLKPKLEKLAAEYHPRLPFYCVNVNNVPHKLVARAGVTLWKDGKKQAEVIGGHKAHLVVNEVRQMIENESTM